MTVSEPRVFLLLFALVPLVLIQWREYVRGRRDLTALSGHWRHQEVMNLYLVKWFFSSLFFDVALILMVFALAGFTWGQEPIEQDRRGLDIAVAFDISRSMLAQDVSPSRLERSKDLMRAVLQEFPDSRFSVTIFKGRALTSIPLTSDVHSIDRFVDALHPNMFSSAGSDIEAGIRAAHRSFFAGSNRHRVILLFSDGEALDGAAIRAAREAAAAGIPIFAVAAGTEEGSTIELADGTQVRDSRGAVVTTRLAFDSLAAISSVGGGTVIQLQDSDAFSRLVDRIGEHETTMSSEGFRLVPVERYRFFLIPALFCFFCYSAIRVIRWKNLF